jgi:glc operon protein GlcG
MFLSKLSISQNLSKLVTDKAEEEAVKIGVAVSIAIVNEAGQLVHFTKMDGSSNASAEIAVAKARHAVNYQRDTKYHEDFLKEGQLRVLALPNTLSIEGGVQLIFDNKLVGAIGVSGAAATDDGKIARAGAALLASINNS